MGLLLDRYDIVIPEQYKSTWRAASKRKLSVNQVKEALTEQQEEVLKGIATMAEGKVLRSKESNTPVTIRAW